MCLGVYIHVHNIALATAHNESWKNSLKSKVENRDNNNGNCTEYKNADLSGGHECPTTPEPIVTRKLLVFS